MTFTDLQSTLTNLDRADKFRAIRFLASELAKEDAALPSKESDTVYPSKPQPVRAPSHDGENRVPSAVTVPPNYAGVGEAHALYGLPQDLLSRYHVLVERKHEVGLTVDESVEFERLSEELDEADWNSPAEHRLRAIDENRHVEQLATLDSIIDQLTILKSI
jgi:hypothetical protein